DVEDWKTRCPILRVRQQLTESAANGNGHTMVPSADAIDAEIAAVVSEAQQFGENSPWPDPATATMHVCAAEPERQASPAPAPGSRELTFVKATHEALAAAMAHDPTIFVMGEGIGKRGGNFQTTTGLYEKYGPERLCDTPICERGFVGLACGAAMTGTRPVIDFMFADFVLDSVGEILN